MKQSARHVSGLIVIGALLIAGLLIGPAGCGPEPLDGRRDFLIYDRNTETGEYELQVATIETLEEVSAGNGAIAEMRGGGSIQIARTNPRTAEAIEETLRIAGDKTPNIDYTLREDGVVAPFDFHSTMMLTLYHHLEVASDYFVRLGVDRETLGKVPVYYFPRLQVIIPLNLLSDNAAYAVTLDAFLIPPRLLLKDVPLAANRGVIVHEYTHLVFNRLVHGDSRAPAYLLAPWPDMALKRLRSIEEGVADVFAALQTGDPNFIDASISEERFKIDRDLRSRFDYSLELAEAVREADVTTYNPYILGTVIGSAIWLLRPSMEDDALARALLATLRDFGEVEPPFTVATFFNLLHDRLPAEVRPDACELFRSRLTAVRDELACSTATHDSDGDGP